MTNTRITHDEWMQAGIDAGAVVEFDQDAKTTKELAELWNCHVNVARKAADAHVESGKWEKCVKRIPRGGAGSYSAQAYRPVKKGKK